MAQVLGPDGVAAAVSWLERHQLPSGEFESFASPLDDGDPTWVPDSLKFVTALTVLALDAIDHPAAVTAVDRAVAFLRHEEETMAQWRYWAATNPQYDFTPPDADDTACCSMAVAVRGVTTSRNRRVLLGNRDHHGRFYTWLIPHRIPNDPRVAWALRDEWRSAVVRRRGELWATTEAEPDDVDGVVNANVLRYLGRRAPAAAVAWVASVVEAGNEDDCDSWHRNRFTLYAAIADGVRRGVVGYRSITDTVAARIIERVRADGSVGPPLDTAFALSALANLGLAPEARVELAASLRRSQLPDGSWERSVFYYGGPREVFGWGSEALSTASALAALDLEARSRDGSAGTSR